MSTIKPQSELLSGERPLPQIVVEFERSLLEDALRQYSGNVAPLQAMLQIPRKTLCDKLARLNLIPRDYRQ